MTVAHPDFEAILHPSGLSVAAGPLATLPWLRHASTTRQFSPPDSPRVEELMKVQEHLGVQHSPLVFAEQKHTSNIGLVTQEIIENLSGAPTYRFSATDAIVCPLPNVTITIMTADCAPVFLADPNRRIIALAHAGWKGTFSRIAAKTVASMQSLGSNPADIIAWVGPMAGGCCYEVSQELIDQFVAAFPDSPVESLHKGRHLDLVQINCTQLQKSGLRGENVHRSNICTIHHSDMFYSYRADKGTHGRIVSAMSIIEE